MKDRESSEMALSPLYTPLRKRSDDDQEMKIWRFVRFVWRAGAAADYVASTAHSAE